MMRSKEEWRELAAVARGLSFTIRAGGDMPYEDLARVGFLFPVETCGPREPYLRQALSLRADELEMMAGLSAISSDPSYLLTGFADLLVRTLKLGVRRLEDDGRFDGGLVFGDIDLDAPSRKEGGDHRIDP